MAVFENAGDENSPIKNERVGEFSQLADGFSARENRDNAAIAQPQPSPQLLVDPLRGLPESSRQLNIECSQFHFDSFVCEPYTCVRASTLGSR